MAQSGARLCSLSFTAIQAESNASDTNEADSEAIISTLLAQTTGQKRTIHESSLEAGNENPRTRLRTRLDLEDVDMTDGV